VRTVFIGRGRRLAIDRFVGGRVGWLFRSSCWSSC
jgi:hypothetical protein